MLQSASAKGLVLIAVALLLARVAVYYAQPAPGMSPAEIWRGMSLGLRAVVVAAFIMSGYGLGMLLQAIKDRFGKS